MGGTNQFDTNKCHQNKTLDQILNHLHLFWDFPKSLINEYNDKFGDRLHVFNVIQIVIREILEHKHNNHCGTTVCWSTK